MPCAQKNCQHQDAKWTFEAAQEIFSLSLPQLLYRAQTIHRENFDPTQIQCSTLLNIKTGGCPENCAYCNQSAHYNTGLAKEPLMEKEEVVKRAKEAKEKGATRFCLGAAWRGPRDEDLDKVIEMIKEVKALGMETCVTLGLLGPEQALKLSEAGLDFYNHNIDTSEEFYDKIITTRTFADRLKTLDYVRNAGINVCSGGIVGMGETKEDRLKMLVTLANMSPYPRSIPIGKLVPIEGTPLEDEVEIENIDYIRLVATARIMMPKAYIRISAGRRTMSDEMQLLCFMAGINSFFHGDILLTTPNNAPDFDDQLLNKFGMAFQKI